jgi:cell wall-associated NlpC family hydrolase
MGKHTRKSRAWPVVRKASLTALAAGALVAPVHSPESLLPATGGVTALRPPHVPLPRRLAQPDVRSQVRAWRPAAAAVASGARVEYAWRHRTLALRVTRPRPVVSRPVVAVAAAGAVTHQPASAPSTVTPPSPAPPSPASPRPAPSTSAPAPPPPPPTHPPAASGLGAQIAAYAQRFAGDPYLYGGTTPGGFDCSGLAEYVYARFGIALPRTADAQFHAVRSSPVPVTGGPVFYLSGGYAYHVAIYIGGGEVISALNPAEGVKVTPVSYPGHVYAYGQVP